MNNHAPADYDCPFCKVSSGQDDTYHSAQDSVYENDAVIAFISPKWWVNNPGHVLVVPRQHHENLYDVPEDLLAEVYKAVKHVATAIRSTYGCDGTSTRQHNEPAGNQDVWHLHVHVFPRWDGDELYKNQDNMRFSSSEDRQEYAQKLRAYFSREG